MASRGDMIKRARARVDARRAARNRESFMATQGQNIRKKPIVDSNKGRGFVADLAQKNKNLSQLPVLKELNQMRDDFGGALKSGIGNLVENMPSIMAVKALGRHAEEVDAAERDEGIPWWKGGNKIALDQGSYADQFLEPLMGDNKRAYNQAVRDDKVFWGDLERMSGDDYEASHPGYLALLNDPSRLDKMKDDPVRALNYMRSITGDPTNMGFDEFEAWRQAEGRTEKERGLTGTQIAQQLLPQYRQQAAEMYGEGFLGNTAAANYGDVPPVKYRDTKETGASFNQATPSEPFYGGRSPVDELYAETTTMDPRVKGSSPVSKQYKDMWMNNLINSSPRYALEEEEEEQGVPFYQ